VKEVAYISLIPEVKNTKSTADFTFKIGIEKRAVELSPEKTKEMLRNLNESIVRWEGIVNNLGNVVKGLKGACFATSAFLTVKNMATGFSGKAIARQKVMAKYKTLCDSDSKYSGMTRTQCYNELSDKIEKDVTDMAEALSKVNKIMEESREGNVQNSGGLFGGESVVNQDKYLNGLRDHITEPIKVNVGGEEVDVKKEDIKSLSQIRAVLLYQKLKDSNGGLADDVAKAEMEQALRNTALSVQGRKKQFDLENTFIFEEDGKTVKFPVSVLVENQEVFLNRGFTIKKGDLTEIVNGELELGDVEDKEEIGAQIIHVGSDNYLYLFDAKGAQLGVYEVERKGARLEIINKKSNLPKVSGARISMVSQGSCSNSWPKGKAEVSYYEAGKNKGLPAVVPFDLDEGWYVMVPNSGGTFLDDSPQGYTASADVKYLKICNIGPNKLMENGQGDDLCQSFDVNTLGSVDEFIPCRGLPPSKVKALYTQAREAIRQASNQYGSREITIFNQIMKLGEPRSRVGGFECQDFMSPADCKLMFNVCDPVICPPSRCDLGGKMPVTNVIQTGVIGSLALCLPNSAEGIMVPICLSGVQAGLDSYLSILKSEKDCLQKSLETGEHVGICDEITSIYKCEFFWRQLSPVMDQLLPNLIAGLTSPGQRVQGGGEYALVQQSWNTMRKSIDYFKGVYAQNAFRAFNLRNTQEVGGTFCKAFVGTSVPSSANVLNSLLEPESPPQFYAQFSENIFTEATVPATSQYKVYYHIYAGKEQGVQYKVYLKNPPETSYYMANPTVWVKSGYIARGSSADETVDFTAPAGYKELCVVINAEEKCGFKQVTTNFGLDYVKKKFTEEQATKSDITSEKECISGSPSALSLANPNIQAGAEEVANPEISLRGIVRVCASQNPGAGVDKTGSRWKDVGYCGDSSMRCWLDTNSVKEDLKTIEAIEGKSIKLLDESRGLIENEKLNLEAVQKLLASAREEIKELRSEDLLKPDDENGKVINIVKKLDEIIGTKNAPGAGTNGDRAEALALKATIYRMVTMEAKKNEVLREDNERVVKKPGNVEGNRGEESGSSPGGGVAGKVTKDSKEGEFTIEDNSIYYEGTKILEWVKKGDKGYIFLKNLEGRTIGLIVNGKISITRRESEDEKLNKLQRDYTFVQENGRNVLKKEGESNSKVGTTADDVAIGSVWRVKQSRWSSILRFSPYFRYKGNKEWEWSPDKKHWIQVPLIKGNKGFWYGLTNPDPRDVKIIKALEDKDYSEGVKIIKGGSTEAEFLGVSRE